FAWAASRLVRSATATGQPRWARSIPMRRPMPFAPPGMSAIRVVFTLSSLHGVGPLRALAVDLHRVARRPRVDAEPDPLARAGLVAIGGQLRGRVLGGCRRHAARELKNALERARRAHPPVPRARARRS